MLASALSVVNVGYRSTNYWVISAGRSRVLVDLGWPGTMGTLRANLARVGIPLAEIQYGLATHYHIDHAGLAQELKNAGVPLLMIDVQVPFVQLMQRHVKDRDRFTEISMEGNAIIRSRRAGRSSIAWISPARSCTRRDIPGTACRCSSTMAACLPVT
jgi:glyoxylase-like metal-dependent hydrolase (beta-lactamase superfamily II)